MWFIETLSYLTRKDYRQVSGLLTLSYLTRKDFLQVHGL